MRTTLTGIMFILAIGCSSSVSKPSTRPSLQPAPAKGQETYGCNYVTCGGNGTQVRGAISDKRIVIDTAVMPTGEIVRER